MTKRWLETAKRARGLLACLLSGWLVTQAAGGVMSPVEIENLLPGDPPSAWDISGAGDPSIQGFATDISVNQGETIHFKVDTDSVNYRIDIYRVGYYGGDGARLVDSVEPSAALPQAQPACAVDAGTNLVDCGTWAVSASWTASGATSGVYLAKLVREDDVGASHILFVVRDDDGGSDILFQLADTTWQAYNQYTDGSLCNGSSLYPSPGGRASKVSYNRPSTTRTCVVEDSFFNSNYPMVRWLERNGYDVSYFSGVDSDRLGGEIQEHKVFLSVGHDEYWSRAQRDYVTAARDAVDPVHLAFFSGNEVYWKIRWEPSIDGAGTPYRTMVCYKEGTLGENVCGGKCDPLTDVWTGLWRDGCAFPLADGCEPENELTGQISWIGSTAAITVPAVYQTLPIWRNTDIEDLLPAETATLGTDTLGYEWDPHQPAWDATSPPGLVWLSSTSSGGNTHHLSAYDAPSGAIVFGAGTVQWSWGLDGTHDRGSAPPDLRMQQMTVNLFADMGVEPGTLQGDLVPGSPPGPDVDPPIIVARSPANAATGISTTALVTATFDAPVAPGTITFELLDSALAPVPASVAYSSQTRTATLTPNSLLEYTETYTATVSGVQDLEGNPMVSPDSWSFATAGPPACPCSVFGTTAPAGSASGDTNAVELGVKFRSASNGYALGVRFYKFPANTGTHVGHLWEPDSTLLGTVTFAGETASGWQEALFDTPIALTADTTYIVSYHAPAGRYAFDEFYFAGGGVENPPLRALADGEDGPNGVYAYGPSGGFPASTFHAANYWVDVLFDFIAVDETPPVVTARAPGPGATGVSIATAVTATFNEAVVESSIGFQLLDGAVVVPAAFSYDAPSRTASLVPDSLLDYETAYTASISGVEDLTGNVMAGTDQWLFTTGSPPPPPPDEGPGGPILVVAHAANPFGRYFAEILRAEGLNYFTVTDISLVTPAVLADHEVVILGEMPLSAGGVTMLSDWVTAGGKLIAMRPDSQLAGLLGLTPGGGTVAEGYLLIDTGSQPGQGLVAETIQYHGTANTYTLAGAAALAALYTDATTPAASPAVTLRAVGPNGGLAAAFAYDLARSVVYTRQGNPAWAGQERDANPPLRADDMFFPDWVNFDKIAIPQADEQQRLLANLILQMAGHPWPRFWYLPSMHKAAIIMTGDQHGCCGATVTRFQTYVDQSPPGCSVDNWTCVRASSYIYPGGGLTDAEALAWHTLGFELGIHCNTGCADWNNLQLDGFFASQLATFAAQFPSLPPQDTERTHCGSWANWAGQPLVKVTHGIRLDTNYYYWPPSWIQNRPGMFTGSGMPMRFADTDGTLIDVYQAVTQMTDESGQSYPFTVNALLDKAIGPEGYYGAFCANMHTDNASHPSSDAIVASAQARGVPVVSGRQMLKWLDGRNGSAYSSLDWSGSTLSFTVNVGVGANNLRGLIPATGGAGTLATLTRNAGAVAFTTETIKGVQYAIFDAQPGDYAATFAPDTTPPAISNLAALPDTGGTALVTWDTDEASDSRVDYGTDPDVLGLSVSSAALVTSHGLLLSGLAPGTDYYYRAASADAADNESIAPPLASPAASFLTPGPVCAEDVVTADFVAGSPGAATYVAETDDGEVILSPTAGAEFSGAALPPGWAAFAWSGGGAATVSGGAVSIDGARLRSDGSYGPTRSVEFVATFGSTPFQGAGFAGGGDVPPFPLDGAPWAIFSTGSTGAAVQARVNATGTLLDTTIPGSFLGAPHLYRIDWNAGGFVFYIDGALVHSEPVPIGALMRVVASDFTVGGPDLAVDWMRMSPYPAAGTFVSRVFDGGGQVAWEAVTWASQEPAGTSIDVLVRTGTTPVPDGSWTSYVLIPASGGSAAATAQYLQYRADLATADDRVTPALLEIAVSCDLDDETPPLVVLESPAPGAVDVAVGADVTATFSEQMTPATINTLTFTLTPQGGGGAVSAAVSYSAGNLTATLNPDSDLAYGTPYDARVTTVATDLAGIGLAADHVWSFTTVPPDVTAPTVIARSPSPGATGVPIGTDVTATFSEDMNPSTIHALSFTLTPAGGGGAVSASVTYDEPSRVATLNPSADLDLATTYEARVTIAAQDQAGNPLAAADVWTFMTQAPVCFTDVVVVGEFADGTPGTATYVAETGDGEVILAPTEGAEFFGAALPPGWVSVPWSAGGTSTVSGGAITVDGAAAYGATLYPPGRTLEFVATFGAATFQHMGFGVDYNVLPFAMFSTFDTPDTLFARTPAGGNTSLGLGFIGAPHLYKIVWNAVSVEFHIDGALVATHNVAIADSMRPVPSDVAPNGPVLSVNWLRMTPYAAAGSFESRVFDASSVADWDVASWTSSEPAGTGIALLVRTGNTPVPDVSWSSYTVILDSGDPVGASSRYIQYRADLASALPDVTPQLQDVAIGCLVGPDESPPVISNIQAVPGADGTTATITWDTDEPADSLVVYGTDPGSLPFGGTDVSLVFAHEIELVSLEPGTVYYYRVSSEDAAGNDATSPQPPAYLSFTTPDAQCALDDLSADFAAGSFGPGAYLAGTGDGEVILSPAEGAEFSGVALPAGWETHLWNPPAGAVTVAGGALTVDGVRAMITATYGPGRVLEFQATFGPGTFQHMGFAIDYNGPPFAMFSTIGTIDTLFARTSLGGDTNLGLGYIGTPHRYKVVWNATSMEFHIDGAIVATHAVTMGDPMRPAASDFNPGGGVLAVDWARMTPYAAAGTFESQVFDAGMSVSWGDATWTSQEPAGTTLDISVRTGEVAVPDGSWTLFAPVLSSGDTVGQIGRYLQYRADLASTDPAATAVLEDIELLCGSVNVSPQAGDDQRSVVQGDPVLIDVLANDDDPDGTLLPSTVTIVVPPLYGTTEVDPVTGAVTYDHDGTPVGADSFKYTVKDNQDGTSNQALVTLDVVNEVLLDISLRGVSASTTRCIRFELFDCGGGSTLVTAPIAFAGGDATGVRLEVPLGDYECMTAVDPLHTLLRRDDSFGIGDGIHYTADFTDQSGSGGDDQSLRGGNANGDAYVDIFDFGLFTGQWNMVYPPLTCATAPPHADFSGNDMVFAEDFTFIALNFLQQSDSTCCPVLPAAGGPVAEIRVAELQARGMWQLAMADLNQDGWLDVLDMVAFLEGARPPRRGGGMGIHPQALLPRGDGGNWFDSDNWSRRRVPDGATEVNVAMPVLIDGEGASADRVFIHDGGVLRMISGSLSALSLTVGRAGAFTVTGGSLTAGSLTVKSGGTLTVSGASSLLSVGSLILEPGAALVWTGGTIEVDGGVFELAEPDLVVGGSAPATLRLIGGAEAHIQRDTLIGTHSRGLGAIEVEGGTLTTGRALVVGYAGEGVLRVSDGGAASGAHVNVGLGALGTLWVTGGAEVLAPSVHVGGLGALRGSGAVRGGVLNDGEVHAGEASSAEDAGVLTIEGEYTQMESGVLEVEIAGDEAGLAHGGLDVSGRAFLSGTLVLVNAGGPALRAGDELAVVRAFGITGLFDGSELAGLPAGLVWTMHYRDGEVACAVSIQGAGP